MIKRIKVFIKRKLYQLNEKLKVDIKIPERVLSKTGADWDGGMIFLCGKQYFVCYNVACEVGIIDAIRINLRIISRKADVAYRWIS